MVERSPYIGNVGQLIRDLDQAAQRLAEISKGREASKQELNDLIGVLHKVNDNFPDKNFWEEKRFAPEGMDESIEKALAAVMLFKRNQPEKNKLGQKNVEQAIISLFAALSKEISALDAHLKNLKKYKIGQKVEKSGESKES